MELKLDEPAFGTNLISPMIFFYFNALEIVLSFIVMKKSSIN